MDEFTRCVECNRMLFHTPFWSNGTRCFGCRHKDDEEMKLVEQMLNHPERIFSSRERDRAVRYLYGLLNPGLK